MTEAIAGDDPPAGADASAAVSLAATTIGAATAAEAAGVLAGVVGPFVLAAPSSCRSSEWSFADFFGADAGEAAAAAAVGSFPAVAAAAVATACAAAGSEAPGASGGGAAFPVGADDDVVFDVAEATLALSDPSCRPAAAASGLAAAAAFAAAVFAAVAAVCFSPLPAMAFKIAVLALTPVVPGALAAALAWPPRSVVP